jgi:glycerol-3-phosphate cytidylyltransferase
VGTARGDRREAAMAQRIGYVPGVYDLFHIGHLNVLRNAREFCDVLIAGVVSDDIAQRNKGITPIVPIEERLAIVESVRYVDRAVVEDVPHKLTMWERLGFTVIVKGDDWRGTDRGDKLEQDFAPLGVTIAYVPYTPQTSSTILRRVIQRQLEWL